MHGAPCVHAAQLHNVWLHHWLLNKVPCPHRLLCLQARSLEDHAERPIPNDCLGRICECLPARASRHHSAAAGLTRCRSLGILLPSLPLRERVCATCRRAVDAAAQAAQEKHRACSQQRSIPLLF